MDPKRIEKQMIDFQKTAFERELESIELNLSEKQRQLLTEIGQLRDVLRATDVIDLTHCYQQLHQLRTNRQV